MQKGIKELADLEIYLRVYEKPQLWACGNAIPDKYDEIPDEIYLELKPTNDLFKFKIRPCSLIGKTQDC